uniref:Glycosyl transferase family 25 domain-containing protein n=1 Tax=viral metagenome TaxID=1070528 RepID=A0A6C0HS78_9ZZZZ
MKAYYINLSTREDRKLNAIKQLSSVEFDFERFNAVYSSNGRLGCSLSHLAILELAKKNDLPEVIICEDDICFKKPEFFKKQLKCFLKSQKKWDVLLLGGNITKPYSIVSPYAIRAENCQTTTGYIVKSHYYETLIHNIREGIKNLLQYPKKHFYYAIDKYWLKLQKQDEWYLIYPLSVTQKAGYSDVEKKEINYESLMLS